MSSVLHVKPTGNATTDTANIQNAIDQLTQTTLTLNPGTVILSGGLYHINDTLTFGTMGTQENPYVDPTYGNLYPPRMVGATGANIRSDMPYGSTKPMILYCNPSFNVGVVLQNLTLWPNKRCRGIRAHRCTYQSVFRDILIRQADGIAMDLIDCWGCDLDNVAIQQTAGIGLRMQQMFSCTARHLEISNGQITNLTTGESGYPAVDEEVMWDYGGSWIQTPEDGRGAVVLQTGSGLWCNGLMMEGNDYGTDPGLAIRDWGDSTFNSSRWEGASHSEEYVKILYGRRLCFTQAISIPASKCFVRATGTTGSSSLGISGQVTGVTIDRCSGGTLTDGALICAGGTQQGHTVSRITGGLALDKWIVEENSPTMSGKICADSDHSVSIPWQ